ncbi:MAG TPA: ACP S-malonyltransferase [Acidimicrobiales bacterium]|nr:ACP S-malonyltransferase [Acidimicrobiales bacterium]
MLAFTFPGQGSQRRGMGRPWAGHPSWEVVGEASEVAGRDLGRLLLEADQDELTLTANAQLATYVLSLVVLDAIERVGIEPTACAGHSLGEYTALTASGALGFEDGVRLVVERGEAMHHTAEERTGTMAAVLGADDDAVEAACQRAEGEVWVANYNAPSQVVIAGDPEAVARAGEIAKELGARRVMAFAVAGAFHTALMTPARARLRKALADTAFSAPEIPVVANVDGRVHAGADDWPALLSAQLCSPVRWHQSLATLAELGATQLVEVGPGGVLTGLTRRTLPDAQALAVATPDDLGVLVDTLSGTETWHTYASEHQGEHLYTSERVVVSPAAGIFSPDPGLSAPGPGGSAAPSAALSTAASPQTASPETPSAETPTGSAEVVVGGLLGRVGEIEVRTPFAGQVVGFLAHRGERVVAGQPLAWLRVGTGT